MDRAVERIEHCWTEIRDWGRLVFDPLIRRAALSCYPRRATIPQLMASGPAVISSGVEDARRVLLLGSGITSGWGVRTHGLALVGALQAALQTRTGVAVDVTQQAAQTTHEATLDRAIALLGNRARESWDAIVIAFGLSDVMRMTPTHEWAQGLERLLARLDADLPGTHLVPIVLVGVPPIDSLGAFGPFRAAFRRHAARFDLTSQQAAARNRRVRFVPLPGLADGLQQPGGSSAAYRVWAAAIADTLAPILAGKRREETHHHPAQAAPTPSPLMIEARPHRTGRRRPRLRAEGRALTELTATRSIPPGNTVRIPGPDMIRVLIVGGDYGIGFGAADRTDALDGALARLLHTRTGRGVLVENRARHLVRLEQLAMSLGPSGAHTFDLVLWTPTFAEGTRLLIRSRWIAGLGGLIRRIESTSHAGVVLLGFPGLLGLEPLAVIGSARSRQMNRLLRRIAGWHRATAFVEPPPVRLSTVETVDSASVYRDVAIELVPSALRLVNQLDGPSAAAPVHHNESLVSK